MKIIKIYLLILLFYFTLCPPKNMPNTKNRNSNQNQNNNQNSRMNTNSGNNRNTNNEKKIENVSNQEEQEKTEKLENIEKEEKTEQNESTSSINEKLQIILINFENYTKEFHIFIKSSLKIDYPFDLIFFVLLGFLFKSFSDMIFSKKVNKIIYFRNTFIICLMNLTQCP